MELHTPEAKKTSESLASTLSADLVRILEAVRKQLEAEFEKRLETSIRETETAARLEAEKAREEAVEKARLEAGAELSRQLQESGERVASEVRVEMDRQFQSTRQQWDRERQDLQEESAQWRRLAEAQQLMGQGDSQSRCLQVFLEHAQYFAGAAALYVGRREGLKLWRARGDQPFPEVISRDAVNPEYYFRPVVIRTKTVAAIYAAPPLKKASLDVLAGALSRAIETIGMTFQNRRLPPEAPAVLKSRSAAVDEKAIAEARFSARVLIADIKFRHEAEMRDGRENADLYSRLKEPIEKARRAYRQRVSLSVLAARDFFHDLLVEILADGEAEKMGEGYPGPQVSQGKHV